MAITRRRMRKHVKRAKKIGFLIPPRARKLPSLGGNPRTKLVRLRYCEELSFNAGAGLIAVNVFRANGMFDPNFTGVGHQPLGFDQTMVYYDHFQVIGAKCTAQFIPSGTSNVTPSYLGVLLSDDGISAASFSNVNHMLESRQFGTNYVIGGVISGYGTKATTARKTYSQKKFFHKGFTDSTLKGTAAADPTDGAFFEVVAASVGGADSASINVLVTIDYLAVVTEPIQLAQS